MSIYFFPTFLCKATIFEEKYSFVFLNATIPIFFHFLNCVIH